MSLAYQFLPLYEHYISGVIWPRAALLRMQMGQSLDGIVFVDAAGPFPNQDIENAIQCFHDGMVFLSIAFEIEDIDTLARKTSIAIQHFVGALVIEFEGTRYPRTWNITYNELGVLERHVSPRLHEVAKFQESVWTNIADKFEVLLYG
jgi:hypothetical protein